MATDLVPIVDEDGSVSYVRPGDVQAAQGEGARTATRSDVIDARSREGLGGAVATADAFVRGATLGGSDWLQVEGIRALQGDAAARDIADQTESLKRVHGDVTDMAELLGGFAVPVPGSGAAKGLGTGLAKGLAGGLERGALTWAIEHAVPAAVQGAWEGAAQGAGSVLSEAALGDREVTAEKLFAGAGKGALFGGALSGAVGLGAGLAERGLQRAAGKATDVAKSALGAAVSAAGDAKPRALRGLIVEQAEQQAFRATGAKIGDIQKLGGSAEQQIARSSSIGRRLLDEGIVTAGSSKADIAERVAVRVKEVGEELGALRKELDTTGRAANVDSIVMRAHNEVLAPLTQMPGASAERTAVGNYLSELSEILGPETTFEKLHETRAALDKKLGWDKLGASAGTEQLRQVRSIIEDEFTAQAEKAAALKGETFAAKYNVAKQAYSELRTVDKIMSKEVARTAANRAISLTDTIAGVGGLAALGPTGLLLAGVNKGIREYGNQLGAVALDKLARLESVQRVAQQFDASISREVSALSSGTRPRQLPAPSSKAAAGVAREMLANPEAIQARVSRFVGESLRGAAPETHGAVTDVAIRATTFLASKAPRDAQPVNVLQPKTEPRAPSAQDVAKFAKYIQAIDDPNVVVRGLARGDVSREQVEAVRAVYPRLFAVMQGRIQEEVAKLPKALPYPTRVALSVMFDVPLDASMAPQMVAGFQQQYAQQGGAPGPAPRKLDVQQIVKSTAPATSRIEGGP